MSRRINDWRIRRTTADETGASLIMVTIFVMVFAVVGAAILDFASVGFRTTESIASTRDEQHAVDGATEAAINAIRGSNTAGFDGFPCPDFTYDPPSGTDDPTVVVTCEPAGGTTGGVDDDQPKYAVLTLGTAATDGLSQIGTEELVIDGGMFSNSVVTVGSSSNASINVFGDALAVKACTPEISPGEPEKMTATGELLCRLEDQPSHELTAGEPDPNYPAAISALTGLPVDPSATCNTSISRSVVKFVPGVYTEHPKNHVPAACTGRVWWFSQGSPIGAYYFDFADDPDTAADESKLDLEALGISVVGGTPLGWSESAGLPADTAVNALIPPQGVGACDKTASGVQLIFGGTTRLWAQKISNGGITVGRLNLCSSATAATNQQIALYGLKSGATPADATVELSNKTDPTGPYVPNAATKTDDGTLGSTTIIGAGGNAASEIVTQVYADFEEMELGGYVKRAWLDVYHSESSSKVVPSIDVTIDGVTTNHPLTQQSSVASESIEITDDLSAALAYQDINTLSASFKADGTALDGTITCPVPPKGCKPKTGESSVVSLDAVVLRVEYRPLAMRAYDPDCGTSTDCPIFESGNNGQAVVNGTLYAPTALLTLRVHNAGEFAMKRGVIARKVIADANASLTQEDSPFSLPGLTNVRRVLFTARVDGDAKLRAVVRFTDTKGGLSLPGYVAEVESWIVLR